MNEIVTDKNCPTVTTINSSNTNESVTDNNSVTCESITSRNTEKKWSRSDAIVNRQIVCRKCGRTIGDGEPIVRGKESKYYKFTGTYGYCTVTYCTDCKPIDDNMWLRAKNCAVCGRPVYIPKYHRYAKNVFCCHGCEYDYYNKRVSHAKREARVKTCPVCGSIFSGQRSDTVYCSFACKQKHYRKETIKC